MGNNKAGTNPLMWSQTPLKPPPLVSTSNSRETANLVMPFLPKVVLWVLWWPLDGGCKLETRATKEFTDVIDVCVDVSLLGTVAMEGNQHPLSNKSFYLLVSDEQHHTVEVETFAL